MAMSLGKRWASMDGWKVDRWVDREVDGTFWWLVWPS